MNSNNPILNAVVSKLIAERDEALVRLNLFVNGHCENVPHVVDKATKAIKDLTKAEQALATVRSIIQDDAVTQQPINKPETDGTST